MSNLNVLFFLGVVICCYVLHNMILTSKNVDIVELLFQLEVGNVQVVRHGDMGRVDD
jgi:hypothetical protein